MNELELEIFRAGDYGPRGQWSESQLDRLAANYDPALHEAPVTLDHAQTGPALGWVASVARRGDRLVARLRGLREELVDLLRDGAFKKRSVEIYRALPETGAPYLKAVSFLGAAAPAVKGLRDVLFSETEPLAQFETDPGDFTAFELDATGSAVRYGEAETRNREHRLGSSSPVGRLSKPTSGHRPDLPSHWSHPAVAIASHSNESFDAANAGSAERKNDPTNDPVNRLSPASNDSTCGVNRLSPEGQLGSSSEVSSPAESTPPALAFAEIADPLRRSGRFLPAWEERGIEAFFTALASAPAFAPRPGETITPQRWFADFLAGLPAAVPMGEAAPARPQPAQMNGMISSVDRASPDSLELHRRVLMLRDSQPHLSYAQALREVARH